MTKNKYVMTMHDNSKVMETGHVIPETCSDTDDYD